MFYLSNTSKKNREGVDPRMIEISDLAIDLTLVDFGHGRYAGLRTAATQNMLFISGKSECDGVDRVSNHQAAPDGYGKALDFYAYVDGKISYDPLHLAMVAAAHLEAASRLGHRIRWGGLWSKKKNDGTGWDMPHLELLD